MSPDPVSRASRHVRSSEGSDYGEGRAVYPNGDIYEGTFVAGQRQGPGRMVFSGGQEFDGEWKEGEPINDASPGALPPSSAVPDGPEDPAVQAAPSE